MSDCLSLTQVVILCGYVVGMAGGQLLFKAASSTFARDASIGERFLGIAPNRFFPSAIILLLRAYVSLDLDSEFYAVIPGLPICRPRICNDTAF